MGADNPLVWHALERRERLLCLAAACLLLGLSLALAAGLVGATRQVPSVSRVTLLVCLAMQCALALVAAPLYVGSLFARYRQLGRLDELVLTGLQPAAIGRGLAAAGTVASFGAASALLPLAIAAAFLSHMTLDYLMHLLMLVIYGEGLCYVAAAIGLLGCWRGLRIGAGSALYAAFGGVVWALLVLWWVGGWPEPGGPAPAAILLVVAAPMGLAAWFVNQENLTSIIADWPFEEEEAPWWRGPLGRRRLGRSLRALETTLDDLAGSMGREGGTCGELEAANQVWRAVYSSLGVAAGQRLRPRLRGDVTALAATLIYADRELAEMAANAFCQKVWSLMRVL